MAAGEFLPLLTGSSTGSDTVDGEGVSLESGCEDYRYVFIVSNQGGGIGVTLKIFTSHDGENWSYDPWLDSGSQTHPGVFVFGDGSGPPLGHIKAQVVNGNAGTCDFQAFVCFNRRK